MVRMRVIARERDEREKEREREKEIKREREKERQTEECRNSSSGSNSSDKAKQGINKKTYVYLPSCPWHGFADASYMHYPQVSCRTCWSYCQENFHI